MALSQLSRAVEQRVDKRPILSDLLESGGIEANTDLVLLFTGDDYYHPDTEKKAYYRDYYFQATKWTNWKFELYLWITLINF